MVGFPLKGYTGLIQKFYSKIEDAAAAALKFDKQGKNVYYGVASFSDEVYGAGTKNKRIAGNVVALKTFFYDIDCGEGKPFPSWKEGLVSLGKTVKLHNLPKPMVVRSGNGLHVYWVMDRELSRAEWIPIAQALKAVIPIGHDRKPLYDPAVPADTARVLRPVGTHNARGGGEVKVVLDAPAVSVEDFAACLKQFVGTGAPLKKASESSILANMAVQADFPPAEAGLIYKKCQQIQGLVKNQADVGEPQWYNLMGIAAHCTEPENVAIAWSDQHPDYDQETTLAKLDQWRDNTTGPATCAAFMINNPSGCDGCKYKDKITTPCRLGIKYEDEAIAEKAPDEIASIVEVPAPFRSTKNGMTYIIDDIETVVCPFSIYAVSYGKDRSDDYEVVRFHWERVNVGWQELTIRMAHLTDGHREFASACADQGIILDSKEQTGLFQIMLRAYMHELRRVRTISNLHSSMGWKNGWEQFLLGDTLFKLVDGKVVKEGTTTANVVSSTSKKSDWHTNGDPRMQNELLKCIPAAKLNPAAFAVNVSLSSILYEMLDFNGLTISYTGKSGAGKTIAQLYAQGIWGNPKELHVSANTTEKAMYARFGRFCNLVASIDEATTFDIKDVGRYLYNIAQGQDTARLYRDGTERPTLKYHMPVLMSSNRSFMSILNSMGMETEAQALRLLEFDLPRRAIFEEDSKAGRVMFHGVRKHYGFVGEKFLTHIMALGADVVRAQFNEHREQFTQRTGIKFRGPERMWENAIMVADFAGSIAYEIGAIPFSPDASTQWVGSQLAEMRESVSEKYVAPYEVLSEYFNARMSNAVTAISNGGAKPMIDYNRVPVRDGVRLRFEIDRKDAASPADAGRVLIDVRDFKVWLTENSVDYKYVTNWVAEEKIDCTPKIGKAYLAKGTELRIGQVRVLGIDLTHADLVGILREVDASANEKTSVLDRLQVVK